MDYYRLMETSGFYKLENGQIIHGPNYVLNMRYELYKENRAQYEYPVDGWYWFDSEDEAYAFLGIEKPSIQEPGAQPYKIE